MLDTPNCRVNPTAPSARIADVTSPKPIARVSWFMRSGSCSSSSSSAATRHALSAVQGRTGDDQDRIHRLVGRIVVVVGEGPLGAVVAVEGERAPRANILDVLARLELPEPFRVAVHPDEIGRAHV